MGQLLTDAEREVIAKTVELWDLFKALPEQHPMHQHEISLFIHGIQRLVMSRPVARDEGWVHERNQG